MLDGRDAQVVTLSEHGAALCVNNVLGNGVNGGHSFQVDALYFVTRVLWGGVECHREAQSRMQAFAAQ